MKKTNSLNGFINLQNNRRRSDFSRFVVLFLTAVIIIFTHSSAQAGGLQIFNSYQPENPFNFEPNVWERTEKSAVSGLIEGIPNEYNAVRLNRESLVSILQNAPHEEYLPLGMSQTILPLPMPDGTFEDFRIQEAPVLEPSMRESYPEIKSYRLVSVKNPSVTGRFDLTPLGFHAIILANETIIGILPADRNNANLYASFTDDQINAEQIANMCSMTKEHLKDKNSEESLNPLPQIASGTTLRTYRIAIATTWEYSNALGGTTAATVASLNTWVNSINAIYEREVSVRILLVNNTNVLYTTERGFNANTDPFTDNDQSAALREVPAVLDQQVGNGNFNVGHVFIFGGTGGVANFGAVCGNFKGGGVSAMRPPAGNIGSILHFAHELGHQFGAGHTFNATGGCADSRSGSSAFETGSGVTIMSYAGVCAGHNLFNAGGKEGRFHSKSIDQIVNFTVNGSGAACPIVSQTGNNPPTVNAPAAFNIPKQTPFMLTATANDTDAGDNNSLTYSWEQYDAAETFSNGVYNDGGDPANTTRPIFRPFSPTTNPSRTFPSLRYILENANESPDLINNLQTAEKLPRIGRTLNFRVTVRDNVGGVNDASTVLTVDGNSGPFNVTSPNTAVNWAGGSNQNITWNVANTQNAPVSAANVKISLSTDGGQTFPIVLAASVPNNGTFNAAIPNGINTTAARVKIEAVNNIFFDVSDANFTIAPGNGCAVVADINPKVAAVGNTVTITGINFTGVTAVRFNNNVNAVFTVDSNTQITATVPAGAIGGVITLVKPGCGDVQTTEIAICPGASATLQTDNGTIGGRSGAGILGGLPQVAYSFNRLTPANYPATISAVQVNISERLPIGTPIIIYVGANTGGTNNFDNTPLRTYARTLTAQNTFASYQIPALTIASGDFVVGYSYATGTPGSNFDNATFQNRSYETRDGVNFTLSNVNYMIRAQIFTGNCTPAACNYAINPTTQNFTGAGGNGTVNITTGANCPWAATRSANWINFTSAANGNGNSALNFTVAANNTALPRTATITVADKTFTVTQEAGNAPTCIYTLDSAGGFAIGAGQSIGRTFNMITTPGCAWTATSNNNWITITGGANGNGNGTITYDVAPNPNPGFRNGSITVGGLRFSFDQFGGAPACNYALNPANVNLAGAAGAGNTFAVNAGANCQWNAATNDNWITITGGNGTGNGTVTFSVAANPSATDARVGTITVGGQAFRVNQAATVANCNYAINPTNAAVANTASENNTFGVATAAGCAWTATTNDNWITISGGANGTGNGTVTYTVAANTGAARNGTITINGQNFTVTQAASTQPCTPVTGGLLNWYRAENDALDTIGGNNGTVGGNIGYGEGNIGQGMLFDGIGSTVSIQRRIADDFTVEFWFRTLPDVTGGTNETDWTQGIGLVANNDFGVSLGNGKILFGVGNVTIASPNTVNDNFWYHVVATRNKTTGAMRLYIDGGTNAPATVGTGNTQTLDASPQLVFGRRAQGDVFRGTLDEIKIYNNEFSDDQARAAFQGCAAGQPRAAIGNTAAPEGNPNQNNLTFMSFAVRLSAASSEDVEIDFETADLTAIDGVDYVGEYGTLTIPAGETVGTIYISLLPDMTDEPNKSFEVLLSDPLNAALDDDEGIGTIIDDDTPCESVLSAAGSTLSASGGAGNTFSVQIPAGCGWAISSQSSWITPVGNPSQNGNATVTYSVAANAGVARTGTITAAGRVFTVNQAASPSAQVSLFGRVMIQNGQGLNGAIVTITDAGGNQRRARTSSFGYYRFDAIQAGQTVTVSVTSKRGQFTTQTISASAELNELNFIAGQ